MGETIIQLVVLGLFGWLFSYVALALGNRLVGGLLKLTTVASCLALVLTLILAIVAKIQEFLEGPARLLHIIR